MSYTPPKLIESRRIAIKPILLALGLLSLGNYYLGSNELWWALGLFGAYSIGYWVGYFARTKDEHNKTDLSWAVTGDTMKYSTTDVDCDCVLDSITNITYNYDPSYV